MLLFIHISFRIELERLKSKDSTKVKASKLLEKLQKFASDKNYSLSLKSDITSKRQRKVVAKTFHGLGIVVPVKNDVGYRPLPDSDGNILNIE